MKFNEVPHSVGHIINNYVVSLCGQQIGTRLIKKKEGKKENVYL